MAGRGVDCRSVFASDFGPPKNQKQFHAEEVMSGLRFSLLAGAAVLAVAISSPAQTTTTAPATTQTTPDTSTAPLTPAERRQQAQAARQAAVAARQQAAAAKQQEAAAAKQQAAASKQQGVAARQQGTVASTAATVPAATAVPVNGMSSTSTGAPAAGTAPAGNSAMSATPNRPGTAPAVGTGTLSFGTRVYSAAGCAHNGNRVVCTFTFVNQGNDATLRAGNAGELAGVQLVDDAHVPHKWDGAYFLDKYGSQQPSLFVQKGDSGTYLVDFANVDPRVTSAEFHLRTQVIGGVSVNPAGWTPGQAAASGAGNKPAQTQPAAAHQ
jgi:hypothetical protein